MRFVFCIHRQIGMIIIKSTIEKSIDGWGKWANIWIEKLEIKTGNIYLIVVVIIVVMIENCQSRITNKIYAFCS